MVKDFEGTDPMHLKLRVFGELCVSFKKGQCNLKLCGGTL
jgi:hypothetical protein